ncbi:hypothetical protein CDAR_395161 [Caerostris darwini]|uniref:Uncharacterized protein n=1 Tax=Caerostris darwini TaxID=1538125 RepID=A0AAV4QAB1_9ARAC|nr:hypothetical protein CDAR_395161 [Caerostris darwini]
MWTPPPPPSGSAQCPTFRPLFSPDNGIRVCGAPSDWSGTDRSSTDETELIGRMGKCSERSHMWRRRDECPSLSSD